MIRHEILLYVAKIINHQRSKIDIETRGMERTILRKVLGPRITNQER